MIFSMATSKGGSGKSTLTILMGSMLATAGTGLRTRLLCADPQHSTARWAERVSEAGRMPENLTVERIDSAKQLDKAVEQRREFDVSIIDPQGSLNEIMLSAIYASDLVIVPCKASVMDAVEAIRVFEFAEKLHKTNLRLVLNDVKGIDQKTGAFKGAVSRIQTASIPFFRTVIMSRPVFAHFSEDAGRLEDLATDASKTEQIEKAQVNIANFVEEAFMLAKGTS